MPSLAQLTDSYDPQPSGLPVEQPVLNSNDVTLSTGEGVPTRITVRPEPLPEIVGNNGILDQPFSAGTKIGNRLTGLGGEQRYQTWPERMIREGLAAPGDYMATDPISTMGLRREDITDRPEPGGFTVTAQPVDNSIEAAMATAALAGTGGLAGGVGEGAALGSTPMLRPALKYGDKIYKAPANGQHLDAIPSHLADEFQKQALSGEDISNYNFGFVNHKGQFLDREKALDYAIKEGLVDPQAAQYRALTSTLMSDSSKPGVAIEALAKTNPEAIKPTFYSALEHNVNNITQSKMTGEQWLGTLSNKPGVKPEEMQWTGLQDFLNENKGKPVTKEQIVEHLQNNKVELKEVTKGTGELKQAAEGLQKEAGSGVTINGHKLYPDEIEQGLWDGSLTPKDLPANLQPHAEKMLSLRHQQESPTKYHSYQLPGGENYREMLMTLPDHNKINWARTPEGDLKAEGYTIKSEPRDGKPNYTTYGNNGRRLSAHDSEEMAKSLVETSKSNSPNTNIYRSSHWDEPNILAHVRMNDRVIDGKKSLHLEEIQSDWHQQGRDKGYLKTTKPPTQKEIQDAKDASRAKETAYGDLISKVADETGLIGPELFKDVRLVAAHDDWVAAKDHAERIQFHRDLDPSKVPDAPFKKTWHELALKRMIREAAEKGYDRLSWTPGEAQAARYDLSKQINGLEYFPEKRSLDMIDKNGNRQTTHEMTPEKLPDYVGKEAAKKLLETTPNKKYNGFETYGPKHELTGVDLKIGGEGMKGFYDNIIPKSLEKLGKEHGVKVKQGFVKGDHDASLNEPFESRDKAIDVLNRGGELYAVSRNGEELIKTVAELKDAENELGKPFSQFILGDKQPQQPIHYIDIPQSLKDVVMKKGQALFSAGLPYQFMPVEGDPFSKDKK